MQEVHQPPAREELVEKIKMGTLNKTDIFLEPSVSQEVEERLRKAKTEAKKAEEPEEEWVKDESPFRSKAIDFFLEKAWLSHVITTGDQIATLDNQELRITHLDSGEVIDEFIRGTVLKHANYRKLFANIL